MDLKKWALKKIEEHGAELLKWAFGVVGGGAGLYCFWQRVIAALMVRTTIPVWVLWVGSFVIGSAVISVFRERGFSPSERYKEDVFFGYLWRRGRAGKDVTAYCLKDGMEIVFPITNQGAVGICHCCGQKTDLIVGCSSLERELKGRVMRHMKRHLDEGSWKKAVERVREAKEAARAGALYIPGLNHKPPRADEAA